MYVTKSTLLNQFFLFILIFSVAQSVKATEIIKLKCEHLINPIGIDNPNPRLSWIMDDDRKGALQKSYRITVGTDSLQLKGKTNIQWDTDQVNSGNNLVNYKGRPLMPFTKYFWKVDVLDQNDKLISSKISSFETGMMGAENWKGTWISDGNDINTRPAPYFRNVFKSAKQIKSARAYIVAAGLYELYLNGKKSWQSPLRPHVHTF
ncbi:glycoside hydrolase family 78 protein [Pedobacter terrae]|uniref:glycoside hydrolase family 78 protein n=1 Tax=Pedobacter terrae TaxID=405671 RepID=UPI002FF68F10